MYLRTNLSIVSLLVLGCGEGSPPAVGQEAGTSRVDISGAEGGASPLPCEEDQLGNAARERSHEVAGTGRLPDLKLCPGTEDWFRLDAREAGSFSASACRDAADAVEIDFAAYREEFGELYRHTNCASSGATRFCVGTCEMEAPGIYYFRVSSPSPLEYAFSTTVTAQTNPVIQNPPGFDVAVVLQPEMARELTVCAPLSKWLQMQITDPSAVTIESTLTYAGYYLDFTLTAENGGHVAYWPQGAGKTSHEQVLDPGRYMIRIRGAVSGCRMFTLSYTGVAR